MYIFTKQKDTYSIYTDKEGGQEMNAYMERRVLEANKLQRHIRGGVATKEKFRRRREGRFGAL